MRRTMMILAIMRLRRLRPARQLNLLRALAALDSLAFCFQSAVPGHTWQSLLCVVSRRTQPGGDDSFVGIMASRSVSKGFSVMSVRGVRSALDRADLVLTGVEVVEILGNAAF